MFNLWKLLEEYRVVVPVLQRDYAQGRKENDYIRKMFLKEIKECICDSPRKLTLDFIYGNIEQKNADVKCFYPLDGQQRLTTFWLIYWYISYKSGHLKEDSEILKKFTYETRVSSKEFCRALCDEMQKADVNEKGVVGYIKSQTWFYSDWLQDPTIGAILRTLGGENRGDDNIESFFGQRDDYGAVRSRLIDENLIQFALMIIGGNKLPISDDLYIKMNARGKPLTDFENFKADLVAWIQNNSYEKFKEQINGKNIKYFQYYPSQIDNCWTDVFWNSAKCAVKSEFDGKIDALYFSFINRFIVNKICLKLHDDFNKSDKEDKDIVAFNRLIGAQLKGVMADDALVKYEGFEIYKDYLDFDALKDLDSIFKELSKSNVLLNINDFLSKITNTDDDDGTNTSGYTFIPIYKNKELVSTSQKERIYFFAICKFLLNNENQDGWDDDAFKKWMRVVKNLTENAAIDNVSAMITCMKLINKLSEGSKDVYNFLNKYSDGFTESQLGRQLKEEKEKAIKILNDAKWEDKIIRAENYAFFSGTIRFLYRNVGENDWDNFDKRFEFAKRLFNENNKVDASTIKKLLRYYSDFESIKDKHLFTSIGYHSRRACWKRDILCSDDQTLLKNVNSLLTGDASPSLAEGEYKKFLNSRMLEYIVEKPENYRYRYRGGMIHKEYSPTEGVYVSDSRMNKNKILKTLNDKGKIKIANEIVGEGDDVYIWGLSVKFKYNGTDYLLDSSDEIYQIEKDNRSENAIEWNDDLLIKCPDDLLTIIDNAKW